MEIKNEGVGKLVYETMAKISTLGDGYGEAMRRLLDRCQNEAIDAIDRAVTVDEQIDCKLRAEEFLVLTELVYYVGMALQNLDETRREAAGITLPDADIDPDDGLKN